jgi:ribosome-associated toxin RatA of RatAB toxin-antitoxin module
MSSIRRSARVPYSAEQMYALVNDIESYPQFLYWCRGARVTARSDHTIEATIDVGLAGLHKQFSTRNTLEPPTRIAVALVSGPFKRLHGEWHFTPQTPEGCEVVLELDFEPKASPFSVIFAAAFEEIARSQMNAFLKRAEVLYGT